MDRVGDWLESITFTQATAMAALIISVVVALRQMWWEAKQEERRQQERREDRTPNVAVDAAVLTDPITHAGWKEQYVEVEIVNHGPVPVTVAQLPAFVVLQPDKPVGLQPRRETWILGNEGKATRLERSDRVRHLVPCAALAEEGIKQGVTGRAEVVAVAISTYDVQFESELFAFDFSAEWPRERVATWGIW